MATRQTLIVSLKDFIYIEATSGPASNCTRYINCRCPLIGFFKILRQKTETKNKKETNIRSNI